MPTQIPQRFALEVRFHVEFDSACWPKVDFMIRLGGVTRWSTQGLSSATSVASRIRLFSDRLILGNFPHDFPWWLVSHFQICVRWGVGIPRSLIIRIIMCSVASLEILITVVPFMILIALRLIRSCFRRGFACPQPLPSCVWVDLARLLPRGLYSSFRSASTSVWSNGPGGS
ncbi:hypothetical protein R1flu_003091 [Riccia fluitans]|uniref:Uncharacterized protein n=1 Tax=Riccia fluitans TaxID=41844 RepID=A0ABD1Y829_9MARC